TILVPWVVWSGVYAVGLVLHALRHHQPLTASLEWRMLFYGTALHLWFLPFILAANLAAVWLTGLFGRWPLRRVVATAVATGAIVLFVCAWVRIRGPLGPPFLQWLFSIPCIPLGVAVGRAIAMGPHRRPTLVACALLGAAIATVGGVHEPWVLLEWELLRRFGLGVLLVCLAAVPVGRTDPVTNVLIRNTFGIYLVHPLVISLMSQCGLRFDSAWPQALLVYTASLLVAAGLHRTRWAQFV
ncbi:MAG: acyltransferase family protein, partial [Planctomycetes bacterium]|nr:acyltransferase family protein [Planctomycetota bacterium]